MSRVTTTALQAALRRPTARLLASRVSAMAIVSKPTARSFSHLPTLRPTLVPSSPVFRSPTSTSTSTTSMFQPTSALNGSLAAAADVVPKSSLLGSHPSMDAAQIRAGPRNTMNRSTRLIQKRRHGFLARKRSKTGQKILKRRICKGRKRLAAL